MSYSEHKIKSNPEKDSSSPPFLASSSLPECFVSSRRKGAIWRHYPNVRAYILKPLDSEREIISQLLDTTDKLLGDETGWRIFDRLHITLMHEHQEEEDGDRELESFIDKYFDTNVRVLVHDLVKDDQAAAFAISIVDDSRVSSISSFSSSSSFQQRLGRLHMTVATRDGTPPVHSRQVLFAPERPASVQVYPQPPQSLKTRLDFLRK